MYSTKLNVQNAYEIPYKLNIILQQVMILKTISTQEKNIKHINLRRTGSKNCN